MKTVLSVVTVLTAMMLSTATARAENNPSVTGGFTAVWGFNTFEINVTAVLHKDGSVTGRLKLHQVYDNGVFVLERNVDAAVDELVIIGNRAFGRAGQTYFAIEDGGEGKNAAPDKFTPLFFLSPTPPPLSLFIGFLNSALTTAGADVTKGNVQVRD